MKENLLHRLASLVALAKGTNNKNESDAAILAAKRIRLRLQNEFGMSDQEINDWLQQNGSSSVEEQKPPPTPPSQPTTRTEKKSVWSSFVDEIVDSFNKSFADKLSPNENFGPIKKVRKGLYCIPVRMNDVWQANLLKYAARRAGCFYTTRHSFLDGYVVGVRSDFVRAAIDYYQSMEANCIEFTEKKFQKLLSLLDRTGVFQGIFSGSIKVFRSVFLLGVSSSAEIFRSSHKVDDIYDQLESVVQTARDRWMEATEKGEV